ncbi:hypothetical protein TBK1r_24100 [Stieleria magnilauensis]|uniref:Outer membrane efflux protein n=1 Tax=Stieleria magnilauensis TaxID=2527963 RepID=A0ABX5XUD8_9BACT|nr:hypothetical protein TBK1r_24100 [Planctomycetes bacterium TBK1r]
MATKQTLRRVRTSRKKTSGKRNHLATALLSASLAALTGLSAIGCHRQYYRKQADQEVACLLQEKTSHLARRPNADLGIDVDRRSRMYNPFDLDFQPMPMDDPASHRYMQCVDGRRGYPMWDAAGFTNSVENPDWYQFLPLDKDGVLVLNADTAVQIALLHSTEYQQQLETLYLSALDVSSERFQFDTQFFGGSGAFYDMTGGGDSSQLGVGTTGLSFNRAFAHGGSLVAGVANNIVWELSGNNTQSATSLMSFELFQPLLRAAGRDKVMTRLTLAERSLLANIRSFERFRRSFYLNVTVGRGLESQVRRSGGVFGVGLSGFTGLGSGLVGGVGGGGGGGFGGVQDAGGFMGLLQDQLQIRNLEENIARLSENQLVLENTLIELLTTIPDDPQEIVSQRLQVAQQKSALLNSQSQLVTRQAAYQASLDRFLGTLGLPPYICARIQDPLLERFELIDRDLRSRREELIRLRSVVGELNLALLQETESGTDPDTGLPVSRLSWTPVVEETVGRLRTELEPLEAFLGELQQVDAPIVATDIAKLAETIPQRIKQNDQLVELYEVERENICTLLQVDKIDDSVFDVSELATLQSYLGNSYDALMGRLESYRAKVVSINDSLDRFLEEGPQGDTPTELSQKIREELILATQDLLSELGDDILTMQLIQARARTESALLPEVNIQPAEAFEIARRNRRDWANARAALVDSWRAIEFIADDLESSLDIRVSGGVGTAAGENNPFALRGKSSTLSVGLEWDAPITRLQERNTYRQSLIEFEQAKRGYYEYEDSIWLLLRAQVRQLQVNRVNFEYGRQAVRIAASQIELNGDIRELRDARGLSSGPTAARDTISALGDLLDAQNSLLNIFVNYEVIRRGLDLDLGTMELTPEGLWIDPGPIEPDYLLTLPGTTTEAVPGGDCSRCGIRIKNQPQPPDFRGVYINEPSLLEINQVGFEETP